MLGEEHAPMTTCHLPPRIVFLAVVLVLMMSRARAALTQEELSDVLRPFVVSRSWLVYNESAQVSDAELNKEQALKHVALLTAFQEQSSCRAFTRSVVALALTKLVDQCGMPKETPKYWVVTTTNRLQNLSKAVCQSLHKNPRPEFAVKFQWGQPAVNNFMIFSLCWPGIVCLTGHDPQNYCVCSLCNQQ